MSKYLIGFIFCCFAIHVDAQAKPSDLVAKGKTLATTCVACHGNHGNSTQAMYPKLAGQNDRYIVKQLEDFKQDKFSRGPQAAIMKPFAMSLSLADMQAIAAYYASQKPSYGQADAKFVALGRHLYQGGDIARGITACSACHGPAGKGNVQAGFPALAGQWAEYTKAQLYAFQSGERNNDMNKMMRLVAKKLTKADIEAVASYIQGLHS